jgi:hypothetical protein
MVVHSDGRAGTHWWPGPNPSGTFWPIASSSRPQPNTARRRAGRRQQRHAGSLLREFGLVVLGAHGQSHRSDFTRPSLLFFSTGIVLRQSQCAPLIMQTEAPSGYPPRRLPRFVPAQNHDANGRGRTGPPLTSTSSLRTGPSELELGGCCDCGRPTPPSILSQFGDAQSNDCVLRYIEAQNGP